MSLLNVRLTDSRALVAVDSLSGFVDGNGREIPVAGFRPGFRFHLSKMVPLVHLNAVLAGRGAAMFLSQVFTVCNLRPWRDFDDLLEHLPEVLAQAANALQMVARQLSDGSGQVVASQELVAVGWSTMLARPRAVFFFRNSASEAFECREIEYMHIAPWEDAVQGDPGEPSNSGEMLALMQAQVADARRRFRSLPVGGRFLLAEIGADSITFSEIGQEPSAPPRVRIEDFTRFAAERNPQRDQDGRATGCNTALL